MARGTGCSDGLNPTRRLITDCGITDPSVPDPFVRSRIKLNVSSALL